MGSLQTKLWFGIWRLLVLLPIVVCTTLLVPVWFGTESAIFTLASGFFLRSGRSYLLVAAICALATAAYCPISVYVHQGAVVNGDYFLSLIVGNFAFVTVLFLELVRRAEEKASPG